MPIARVQMNDGRIARLEVPEGTTPQQIEAFVSENQPTLASYQVPNALAQTTPPPQEMGFLAKAADRVIGNFETPLALATGAVGAFGGAVAALPRLVTSGMPEANQSFRNVGEALTYRPRSQASQSDLELLGKFFEESKLAGLMPTNPAAAAGNVSQTAKGARQGATAVRAAIGDIAGNDTPVMAGVGSAVTDAARIRAERAAQFPVPLQLMQGMLTKDFEQLRFERETAKAGKVGAPLRERHADLNEKILQNFDAWVDQTGAESGSLRATGQAVNDAIVKKAAAAKQATNDAYEAARISGDMKQPVSYQPLLQYIEAQPPTVRDKLAPIINGVAEQLAKNDPASTGKISINAMEDIRKFINTNSQVGTPNMPHGIELKKLIDAATDGVGGPEYKRARMLRTRYAREFEDVGVIDKLLSTKPGTRDRAVGYEDVFQHSIRGGTLDDVRAIRRTLQTAGDDGAQAWRELQGETLKYMKDQMIKGVSTDIRGNSIASPAALNNVVRELDADGKLDFIFGKNGARNIRDINDALKDVATVPPGAVNTSGTASVLLDALGSAALGRLPTAAAQAMGAIRNLRNEREATRKVKAALNPPMNALMSPAAQNQNALSP